MPATEPPARTRVAALRLSNGDSAITADNDGLLLRVMSGVPESVLLNAIRLPVGAVYTTGSTVRGNVNLRCGAAY